MSKKLLAATILAAAFAAISLSSCTKFKDEKRATNTTTSGSVVMACDESFRRIMEQEIEVFEFQYPEASILARYIPEDECIDSLLKSSNTRLAVTTRQLTKEELAALKLRRRIARSTRIAVDAIALIANPANPIEEISTSDLGKILSGEITEWKWVEPGNKSGKINIVFDYEGSSTVNYMVDSIMHGRKFGSNVYAQNDNSKVFEAVTKMKGALGIIGVSWVSSYLSKASLTTEELARSLEVNDTTQITFDPNVKVLAVAGPESVKGVKPYQAYIFDGSYPLYRSIYLTSTGGGGTLAGGFYSFVTGFAGQKLIQQTGVLPGSIHPRMVQIE